MGQYEKRKHPRVQAKISVYFKNIEQLNREFVQNISLGGLFIQVDQLLEANSIVDIELHFPNHSKQFLIQAKVVRTMVMSDPDHKGKQRYGVGVRFIDPDKSMLDAIQALIDHHG